MSYDITTYAGLVEAIQGYTECDEPVFVANIPNFVKNTEKLVYNITSLPASRLTATVPTVASDNTAALPSGFISAFSLAVIDTTGEYNYLLNKDVNYIQECYPFPTVVGLPKVYALLNDSTIKLGPTPNEAYSMLLEYMGYPASLVSAGTTWLSTNYPNVMLWGSLMESYIFLKGEADIIQMYQAKFQEAVQLLKQTGDGKNRMDNYRTTQFRQPVQ